MAEATFESCLNRIKTDILTLGLEGIASSSNKVAVYYVPWDLVPFDVPITIHPAKPPEDLRNGPGTCAKDDIGYGCQVTMLQPNSGDRKENMMRFTRWREEIRGKFHEKRLSGVTTIYKVIVESHNTPIPRNYREDNMAHAFVIRCWSRELRS